MNCNVVFFFTVYPIKQ